MSPGEKGMWVPAPLLLLMEKGLSHGGKVSRPHQSSFSEARPLKPLLPGDFFYRFLGYPMSGQKTSATQQDTWIALLPAV